MLSWLSPIINASQLYLIIRPNNQQLPTDTTAFNIGQTSIANLDVLEAQDIAPVRAKAHYQDAIQELDKVHFGAVNEGEPANFYKNGVLSIEQAFMIVRAIPDAIKGGETVLMSHTAIVIWRWAAKLYILLNAKNKYCNQLRETLNKSIDALEQERLRFLAAYANLEKNQGNKQENLSTLQDAYTKIKGSVSGNQSSDGRDGLYPLAPQWDGLDNYFNRYKNQLPMREILV